MNIRFLIDAITQQTTVLIAQLATVGGIRAPLAHIANQVFLDLGRELDDLGVTRKVAADMFGLALRSYHAKMSRLEKSASDPARRSLWEAVYEHVSEKGPCSQVDVLRRFCYDDEGSVRGILFDLVESGLVYQSGGQESRIYRATSDEEFEQVHDDAPDRIYWSVWMFIYRNGPVNRTRLSQQLPIHSKELDEALTRLADEGRIEKCDGEGETTYSSDDCFIPIEEAAGWEAAVFDHFGAVTSVLTTKLRQIKAPTLAPDVVGGSTYTFDVWDGHPMRDEVMGQLSRLRAEVSALNARVRTHNKSASLPETPIEKAILYFGQTVIADVGDEHE
ncbi:MAG: hypothetical protein ACNA8W_11180 [Bradymonadaceae bacterium]